MTPELLAFTITALVLVMTPGPDFAVVVPNALRSSKAGIFTTIGTATGLALHAGIAALGLSAIILASDIAFSVVKYAGALFLVFLGIRSLRKSRRSRDVDVKQKAASPRPPLTAWHAYRQGLVINALNPKAPLIYLSIMPQFLHSGASETIQLLLMSMVLVGIAIAWYLSLTILVTRLRPWIERFRSWIDRVSGVVLIALGARVAVEGRPV